MTDTAKERSKNALKEDKNNQESTVDQIIENKLNSSRQPSTSRMSRPRSLRAGRTQYHISNLTSMKSSQGPLPDEFKSRDKIGRTPRSRSKADHEEEPRDSGTKQINLRQETQGLKEEEQFPLSKQKDTPTHGFQIE